MTQAVSPSPASQPMLLAGGGRAMPTMATMTRLLQRGFATLPDRGSGGTVFIAAEGRGELRVGGQRLREQRQAA